MTTNPVHNDIMKPVNAILRSDLQAFHEKCFVTLHPGQPFIDNWHYKLIGEKLGKLRHGETNRLRMALPPRGGKSGLCSTAFPLHIIGHNPAAKVLALSYNQDLANQFSRDRRKILAAPWMAEVFPELIASIVPPETEDKIMTEKGGYIIAASMTGTLTGMGADFIIIDDPLKASDAYQKTIRDHVNDIFRSAILTRLNDKKKGGVLLVQQRLHEEDLFGSLDGMAGWNTVTLPAIANKDQDISAYSNIRTLWAKGEALHPEREDLETLEHLRAQMGDGLFATQYLQRPTDSAHRIVDRTKLRFYTKPPLDRDVVNVVLSVDVATSVSPTADYSVVLATAYTRTHAYVLDIMRGRFAIPDLIEAIKAMSRRHPQNAIIIESQCQGLGIAQLLRKELGWYVHAEPAKGSKSERLLRVLPLIETGHVLFPAQAPWLDTFLDELTGFPDRRHDDQVDALTQCLAYFSDLSANYRGFAKDPRRTGRS